MRVRDYFVRVAAGWFACTKKAVKSTRFLVTTIWNYLHEYIAAAGIAGDPEGPLFRTAAGKTGALTGNAMWQQSTPNRMIQRRATAAGIKTRIGNHTSPRT